MSATYIVGGDYDAGCDDCGEMHTFAKWEHAKKWADNHVCKEE